MEVGGARRLQATAKNHRYWAARDPRDHDELLELFSDLNRAEAKKLFELLDRVYGRVLEAEAGPGRRQSGDQLR